MNWSRLCRWVWLLVLLALFYHLAYMRRTRQPRLEKLTRQCDAEHGVYNFRIECLSDALALGCQCQPFEVFPR